MSFVRVADSVQSAVQNPSKIRGKSDRSPARLFAAACLLTASPTAIALAQEKKPDDLPPVIVEAPAAKPAPKAKKKTTAKVVSPSPLPPSKTAQAPQKPISEKGSNPYANPNAPYKVEQSGSGKLTEPLANTPRTVTAIPKEVIEEKKARDLRDLARDTPGLTIGSAEGGNAYGAFAIRGFKASNDIFVDGIRNPGNVIPDVFSVEQIEIYKGPSGGIAGRSTIGGAVNIITKQPDLNDNFAIVTTTVGTDDTFRTTLDANQKVTPDFAVRANLMYDQNDVAGRDFADTEKWGGLLSATARVTDDVKVTLDYYHYKNDATPDWGVPVITTQHVPQTELGLPRDTWFGEKDLDFYHEDADVGTATVVAKLADGVTLTNRTRVGQSDVDYVATSVEGQTYHHPQRDQEAAIYANQTELNIKFDTGTFHHDVVAGLEVSREEIARSAYTITPSTAPVPLLPNGLPTSDPYRHAAVITAKNKTYDADIDTVAAYVEDTVHLSKEWIVNGGVRFDDFTRDQVAGPNAAATNTAKVQDDLFSWHSGIVYKPLPNSSFYVAYATSESPVGSELDANGAQYNGLSSILVDAPPQEARSVEVGTKWELFDKRLLATAALFQTNVDHARTNENVTAADDTNAFTGEYRVRGIELGAAGNITKDWSVYGGLVLLDTKVLQSSPGRSQEVGRRLANIPLTQFSLLSRYQLTDDLALGGVATYGGEVYGGHLAANDAFNHTVDWWRFDAFVEYELTKNVEIELSGLNLTNELYYDAIYQAPDNPPGGTFAFVAPGRAGYATIKWKY